METLVLNATYEPLDIVHWQRAMTLWCQGKVEIVDTHDKEVRAVSFSFKLPSIVRLLRFVRTRRRARVPFTRANIYARDQFRCQYCGDEFRTEDLTFDHVLPVSRGGERSWQNIVTCCVACNRQKADRTPEEAGMQLQRPPAEPSSHISFRLTIGYRRAPDSWRDYLYWNAVLDQSP